MLLRGVRVYGAQAFAFDVQDGVLQLWVDAGMAPSEAFQAQPGGQPWTMKTVMVHGTDDELQPS